MDMQIELTIPEGELCENDEARVFEFLAEGFSASIVDAQQVHGDFNHLLTIGRTSETVDRALVLELIDSLKTLAYGQRVDSAIQAIRDSIQETPAE